MLVWHEWVEQAIRPRKLILRYVPAAGVGPVAALLAVNVVAGVLPVAFVIAVSALIGHVGHLAGGGAPGPALWWLLAASAGTFFLQHVATTLHTPLAELVQRRVDGRVHDRLIESALRSPGIAPMEDRVTVDLFKEASLRLREDWETPGTALVGQLALAARYTRLAGFVAIVAAVLSWWQGAALLAATLVFRYGQRGGLRRYSRVWQEITPLVTRSDYLRDLATGRAAGKEIRVFGLAGWLAGRHARAVRDWLDRVWRERRRIYLYPYLGFSAIGLVIGALVLVSVAHAVGTGGLTLTGLSLVLQATVAALLLGDHYPESDVPSQFGMWAATSQDSFDRRITAATRQLPVRRPAADPVGLPRTGISLDRVDFRYAAGSPPVLRGLSLELPAGRCTALVGVNGAGKTTLVKLLTRLYEPEDGAVLVDGIDLRRFPVQAWRRQVSVIFQDFIRYELSLAENVALGAAHVPLDVEAVRDALRQVGLLEFATRLPHGLHTPVSGGYAGGTDLSGGQWQRVAIARSLYAVGAGAKLLVLDEPTAALDIRAEAAFFRQFATLTRGVTSLLISHRLSSVRHADRIVVLDGGARAEVGGHDELIARDGLYARMFRLQADRFLDPAPRDGQVGRTGVSG
ncbi:ABC transporter ATP-binding protein/permease [Saccharothrix sp. S26]|uniref:ABC transporter ATP-binding protein n=1 Tax=Saccharothrix sp. S26 TaxID=2907215 RepID=UPI001F2B9FD8|nr:ABC transporter ATP-binding protein [Saccharothrix sp. S26]MCE6995238.1 ABC transporter ATP-binding protein/permease [Saccharothrix sp. S26]